MLPQQMSAEGRGERKGYLRWDTETCRCPVPERTMAWEQESPGTEQGCPYIELNAECALWTVFHKAVTPRRTTTPERSVKSKLKINLFCDAPQEEQAWSTEREGKVQYYRHVHNGSSSGTTISQIRWRKWESEGRYMRHAAGNHLHRKKVEKPTSLVRYI